LQFAATVNISLDGSFLTSITTDTNGNWQALYDDTIMPTRKNN